MRLIDADSLELDAEYDDYDAEYTAVSIKQIETAPTVNAIVVTKCRDCIYGELETRGRKCVKFKDFIPLVDDEYYCADGIESKEVEYENN